MQRWTVWTDNGSPKCPEPMWQYPWQKDVCFQCSAAWGIEGHRHEEISLDSLNLLITLWAVDGEIPNSSWFCVEKCCFRAVGLFAQAVVHKLVNIAQPLPVTDWAFQDAPFIPNHDTITCFQLTCRMFQMFSEHSSTPSLLLPLSQLF